MGKDQVKVKDVLSADQLSSLDADALVQRCLDYQNAYVSMSNMIQLQQRQIRALEQHTIRSAQVAEFARRLNIADRTVVEQLAVMDLRELFFAERAMLFMVDRNSGLLCLQTSDPVVPKPPALDMVNDTDVVLVDVLLSHRNPLVMQSLEHFEAEQGKPYRSFPGCEVLAQSSLLCPLVFNPEDEGESVLGLLVLLGKKGGFNQSDAEEASVLGEMLAASLHSCLLLEGMSELAETDGLTGLYNHRHFQQMLDRCVAASRRYATPLSLMMLDIDHFKKVNDTYGHQSGDLILSEVGRHLRNTVRDNLDVVARYGGEEFVVILPHTGLDGAWVVAERLREAIAKQTFSLQNHDVSITVSIGLAEFSAAMMKSHLIEQADAALYEAKSKGRNCVRTVAVDPSSTNS